jgi:hypothetical protein
MKRKLRSAVLFATLLDVCHVDSYSFLGCRQGLGFR